MKKIVFIVGSKEIGGAESLVQELVSILKLKKKFISVEILYLDNFDTLLGKIYNYFYVIKKSIASEILIGVTEGNSYLIASVISFIFHKYSIIWVHSILSDYYKIHSGLHAVLLALKISNVVISCSDDVYKDLMIYGIKSEIIMNPLYSSREKNRSLLHKKNKNQSTYIFRYFGRINHIKGYKKLVKSSLKIYNKYAVKVILKGPIGDGISLKTRYYLGYEKPSEGYVSPEKAKYNYAIHAPYTESFGLAALEQASNGESVIWLAKQNSTTKYLSTRKLLYQNNARCPNLTNAVNFLRNHKINKILQKKIKNKYSPKVFIEKWLSILKINIDSV